MIHGTIVQDVGEAAQSTMFSFHQAARGEMPLWWKVYTETLRGLCQDLRVRLGRQQLYFLKCRRLRGDLIEMYMIMKYIDRDFFQGLIIQELAGIHLRCESGGYVEQGVRGSSWGRYNKQQWKDNWTGTWIGKLWGLWAKCMQAEMWHWAKGSASVMYDWFYREWGEKKKVAGR